MQGYGTGLEFHVGIIGRILKEGNDESIPPVDIAWMA